MCHAAPHLKKGCPLCGRVSARAFCSSPDQGLGAEHEQIKVGAGLQQKFEG